MGGIFGVVSKKDCVMDLFFGTDYHSHLGTRRGGMAVYSEQPAFPAPFITLKIPRFGQSLNAMSTK